MRLGHVVGGGAWDARVVANAPGVRRAVVSGAREIPERFWDAVRQRLFEEAGCNGTYTERTPAERNSGH